jgi:hypothetical protein
LGTLVEQALPHVLQLFASLVVSAHVPPQSVDAVEGQLAAHAYVPLAPAAQTGVAPAQRLPQLPQLVMLEDETQAPPHETYPLSHLKVHVLSTHAGCALVTFVEHALPHVLQ